MKKFNPQKILVAVDFSTFSREALQAGLEFGNLRDAEVTALHVVKNKSNDHLYTVYGEGLIPAVSASKIREDEHIALANRLELMSREVSEGKKVETLVFHGNPQNEIVQFARSGSFDLIVRRHIGKYNPAFDPIYY
ncbi:MAG: universal stress protein, partial [Nitrospinaceae bacterium]|nr:universal stress protein [Nitrospinaceae bacterium]